MSHASLSTDDRNTIRRTMRQRRNSLSAWEQDQARQALGKLLPRQPFFLRSQRAAFYVASDGEIDPADALQVRLRRHKPCFLPVLHPVHPGRLWFRRLRPDTPLQPNRFGIPEPQGGRLMPGLGLDLVLLPLVAFDSQGGRLGMGAGFYDRSFAFKMTSKRQSPILIGLAHSCQEVDRLPVASWDVPLTAVITEKGIICCDPTRRRDFLVRDLLG